MRMGLAATSVIMAMAICPGRALGGWQTFTVLDGLPYDRVLSVEEDHNGRMWFGCLNGVSVYDGATWETYTWNDLVGSEGFDIFEDSSGNIWVGGSDGVSCYNGRSWKDYTPEDGLCGKYVQAIGQDTTGNMWFGTWYDGVSRFDGEDWTTYGAGGGIYGVFAICGARDGSVWIGSRGGARKFDGRTWTEYLTGIRVRSIFEDRDGNIWLGTLGGGVRRYDGTTFKSFTTNNGLADNYVGGIAQDRWGNMWFGTGGAYAGGNYSGGGGVSRYDGKNWRTYTVDDGLASNDVCSVAVDRLGGPWFGTYGAGVSRYDGASWGTVSSTDGLAENRVYDIMESRSGELWFGTCTAGLGRYDGTDWITYTTDDGLAGNQVYAVAEDILGRIWAGTRNGVSRFGGESWETFTVYEGLGGNRVKDIAAGRYGSGPVWIATEGGGVSRFSDLGWTIYTEPHGLADNTVNAVYIDRMGNLWFATAGGVSRLRGTEWTSFNKYDGLPSSAANCVAEDASGNIWVGTDGGIGRFDGESWTAYTMADGLPDDEVEAITRDRADVMWVGTNKGGVCTFNGECWSTYDTRDGGLTSNCVTSIVEDSGGALWFGSTSYASPAVVVHDPDRVPPKTLILARPAAVTTDDIPSITFCAGYDELVGVSFSYSLDGSPWSEWSSSAVWTGVRLSDGPHVFAVRSRDRAGNVDPFWPVCEFEVDATPPSPVIISPHFDEVLRDTVNVYGTADDARFKNRLLEIRSPGSEVWQMIAESQSPVGDGLLCRWNTHSVPDGEYELRLSVSDTLGLAGSNFVRVVVDNMAPWAFETSPVVVRAATGGDVYSADGGIHLRFPPHAFETETEVRITALGEAAVPDTLAGGALKLSGGYQIGWGGASLEKPAALEMRLGEAARHAEGEVSLWRIAADSTWRRLGGTVDAEAAAISCSIDEGGRYAAFLDDGSGVGVGVLYELSITPRVFSPTGGFASTEAAIGFTLGRPGPVTVRIYNRAGRLVSELMSGERLNAGANLVSWDGRDSGGQIVEDGVYLVAVEALGVKHIKPLAVVR